MMELDQIRREYSPNLQGRNVDILREYLQHEILALIFASPYGPRYTFLGGTCCRLVYNSQRFSEDLNFDNEGLTPADFEATAAYVKKGLEKLGYTVTLKFACKGAFHCAIKFPGLLFDYTLSGHKEARLLIKLDTEKQHYAFTPTLARLQKFGVDTDLRAVPIDLLCAQKFAVALGRRRPKGRDFYDLRYLLARTPPDYGYLAQKFGIGGPEQLAARLNGHTAGFDFSALAHDVEPFLFDPDEAAGVARFGHDWPGLLAAA